MSVARFREPAGVPMEFWDLADERGPFFAYGGPVAYWQQIKGCKGRERDLNWHVAKAMAATSPDKWRQMQAVVVSILIDDGPHAATQAGRYLSQAANT